MNNTRFSFISADGSRCEVEMPKELEANKLNVKFNADSKSIEITAESWSSRSREIISAQGSREKQVLEGSSVLAEKAAEGAAKGAVKGLVPIP